MGNTIGTNHSSVHSAQTVSTSVIEEQKTPANQEAPLPVDSQHLKQAAQKQGQETARMQNLSGQLRSQDLRSQLKTKEDSKDPKQANLKNPQNDSSARKLHSILLTPEREARLQYDELKHKADAETRKILELREKLKKAPPKAKAAIDKEIEKRTDHLGKLLNEKHVAAQKLPRNPEDEEEMEKRILRTQQDMMRSAIRNMKE